MHRWLGPGKKIREYVCRSDEKAADIELNAFAGDNERNAIRLLYCVDMLNEGIHIKDVDGVVMLRPTISPIVYLQQIGRCLACSSDEMCIRDRSTPARYSEPKKRPVTERKPPNRKKH